MPYVLDQRRGVARPCENRARRSRLAAVDRAGYSPVTRGTNSSDLFAPRGLSSDIGFTAGDHSFDPRHSRRISSAPPGRRAFSATAWRRTSPPARHLRSARDPVVRICSLTLQTPCAVERSHLFQRSPHMKPLLLETIPTDPAGGVQEQLGYSVM